MPQFPVHIAPAAYLATCEPHELVEIYHLLKEQHSNIIEAVDLEREWHEERKVVTEAQPPPIQHNCEWCGKDPGIKADNPALWNGFLDQDTRKFICIHCKPAYYTWKMEQRELKGLFSEMPVTYHQLLHTKSK